MNPGLWTEDSLRHPGRYREQGVGRRSGVVVVAESSGIDPGKEATVAFSDAVKAQAYRRSGGRCECTRKGHRHVGRCLARLTASSGHYHHVTAVAKGGSDGLSNCQYLCIPCHRLTPSYGG